MAQAEIIHWQSEGRPLLPDIPAPDTFVADVQRPRPVTRISAAVLSTLVSVVPVIDVPVFAQDIRIPELEVTTRPENTVQDLSCFFSNPAGGLDFHSFPIQTSNFRAFFSARANGSNPDNATVYIGDSPSTLASAYAIHFQFNVVGDEFIVSNGGVSENDVAFVWTAGTLHRVELRINLDDHVVSVLVDDILIATNYDFFTGQGGVTDLDHWALSNTGGDDTIEVCDFTVGPPLPEVLTQEVRISPSKEKSPRPEDTATTFVEAFDAAGALIQGVLRRPLEILRPPTFGTALHEGIVLDAAILGVISQAQLILPPPEHRPPVGLLFDTDVGTFPDVVAAVGTPGDNIIMAVLPKHEVSRPISIAFEWKTAIRVGGMDETDNSASDITNPDTQIVGETRNTLKINKLGSFLQFRMSYDDGLSSITDPVIQAFGRFDSGEQWQRLKTLAAAPAVDVTITTAGTDLTDGTDNFTDPNFTAQTVDLNGTDEVTLRVKTALAGTGDATTAFLQAKLVSGIRTF